ncbi:MAG: BREX-3 system phosphatase PglZ, partial [Deltaproteobacteria bacterium]|nr:BREX-3 system phosphatase PglZ [Deltaproteobacteria bacterium]
RKFLGLAKDLQNEIDERFYKWVVERYAGLYNQPPVPPVMVHHIARAMAREVSQFPDEKVALIVMDGLALDQWIILRDALAKQRPKFAFRENAVFAWIPTVTSVSRQSQFAGKPPLYFPSSINTTSKEASLWFQFWLDKGLNQTQIAYMKGLGNGESNGLKEVTENTRVRVAGLIVDKVDKIMHGMELGTQGMHNQVRQWVQQGHLANIIDLLGEQKFKVWLTSDHGNIEADGIGRPSEGAIADTKGERVRVYSDHGLRGQVKAAFPEAIEWPAIGLPDNYLPLIAQGRSAFIPKGKKTVAHGGISVEEVIVPLIEIGS